MEALVINLATAHERMNAMKQQLARLQISYERLEATTAEAAAKTGTSAYWNTWERPLKDTEKACLMSHMAAWRVVLEVSKPLLILEDDAILSNVLPELLPLLRARGGIDHVTLEARGRKKVIGNDVLELTDRLALRRMVQDRSGAAAYILWPSGAQKLLSHVERRVGLADAVICQAYDLVSFQMEPACAVQQDRCAYYGILSDYEPRSSIDAGAKAMTKKSLKFRYRRIVAQLRMGMRILMNLTNSTRREIRVEPTDFTRP